MDNEMTFQRRWWTLGVLLVALLVIGVDHTIVNIALPRLGSDLHATGSELQWMVEAYVLVFAGLLLTGGALGDRFGRRKALVAGLALFGLASLGAAFADSATHVMVARAVMGVGGALIMPTTLSVLTNVFPERERAKAIGLWAAASSLGIVVGPPVGGWLLDHYWWGSIFLVNVPVAALAIAATLRLVPDSRSGAGTRLDPVGAVLSTVGLAALLYAIIDVPAHGWTAPTTLAALMLGGLLTGGFLLWERRTAHPMLDLRLFRNTRFAGASLALTLAFFALNGGMFFLTQHLQVVLGYTPLEAGVRVMPIAVGVALAAPVSALLSSRFGARSVITAGMAVIAGGLALLTTVTMTSGYTPVLVTLLATGIGIGLAAAPATDSVMASVPRESAGVGSAINDTAREIGGALGVAVLGAVLAAAYRTGTAGGAAGLTSSAARTYTDSVGGAARVAQLVGGDAGAGLLATAQHAFVEAMGVAGLVGALAAAAGAVVALTVLPPPPARGGQPTAAVLAVAERS